MFVHNQQQYFLFRKRLCSFVENFVKFSKIYLDKETCFLSASLEMQWNTAKYTYMQHQRGRGGTGRTKGMTPPFFLAALILLQFTYRSLNFEGVAPPFPGKVFGRMAAKFFFLPKNLHLRNSKTEHGKLPRDRRTENSYKKRGRIDITIKIIFFIYIQPGYLIIQ